MASEVARDDQVHWLHLGKGAKGVWLECASGAKFAFRARATLALEASIPNP